MKIPLVPQWNIQNGCVCTPDGGFLYVGARSINYISSIEENTQDTPQIKVFHTRQSILKIDIDHYWGDADHGSGSEEPAQKFFVVLFQDNSVQIWDFNKGYALQGHQAHVACMRYLEGNGPSPQHAGEVFISYMINRNVLSMDSKDIVVYCVASNSYCRRPMFISPRHHQLTSMKCSPYHENQFAVGTSRGLVLLCDLQKMVTLYTLRGHNCAITSLTWNRIAASDVVAPQMPIAPVVKPEKSKTAKLTRTDTTIVDADDIFDIYDYDYLDNEFGTAPQAPKTKSDSISEFVGIEKTQDTSGTAAEFDFAEACQSLKEEINALRDEPPQLSPEHIVSLEDCKNANINGDTSSCGSASEHEDDQLERKSSEDSMVRLVCATPSSEESVDVDGIDRVAKQQLVCQADVHAALLTECKDEALQTQCTKEENNENIAIGVDDGICLKKDLCEDYLLASLSTDGSLYIWNTSTGATCDHHKLRSVNASKNKKHSKLEISWINSTSFITSNKSGDLQLWTLETQSSNANSSAASSQKRYKFKESKHRWQQRTFVAFSACKSKQYLWCVSSNREITLEDLSLNKIQLQYGCVSTNIGALRECPDDMNKIALAFSDRRIGIIDISKMTPDLIKIDNFVQRIESPVTSLVWSPDCKKIAYGTQEGRIGIISIEGGHKQAPFTFNSVCGKTIYSINWQDTYLFVVCNDRIAVYEDNPNKKDAYIIPDITHVSALSLRNNFLFVGTQNGRLRLYEHKSNGSPKFTYEMKQELELSSRYVTEIAWSPIATNKFAVTANANNIHILEFREESATVSILRKLEIKSPKAANSCVKWSNRNENLLLTCGFDGAIRVWDLSKESSDERFIKCYHCPMKCGLFLPTDEEVIMCAGLSTSLEFIDMRTEKSDENSGKTKRARTLDNVQWASKTPSRNDGKPQQGDKKSNKMTELKSPLEQKPTNCKSCANGSDQAKPNCEEVSKMFEKLDLQKNNDSVAGTSIYMKIPTTLLYLTTKELNKDALDVMFNILNQSTINNSTENKSLCAKLFGSKTEAMQLLTEELKNHQNSETKGISNLYMPQVNGTLKDEILRCVQNKQLSEWHVSLAPSISYNFWQKCCQAYAEQLLEQGYVLQCVVYMMTIHQERDAIEVLIEKAYFKEALLISRIYLQPDDPLNDKINEQWITHLYNNGNLTGAALLCLLSKQNNRAYECLAKIRNIGPEVERVIRLLKKSEN
ncbi:gem nuclear organelle associated protein rigor mortis [Musca autumnalis]|uniref:gem nuclear organelle associated protein rigor mortis n=1 Tax=Musca autumnalis TaxID=221902 RepID=UPI003CF356C0